ncbi:hypothetical protein CL630_00420 [bacterium]|nr:hypothetical protein [bacterium]|tara:strand:- start:23296 stop:23700 length:405 start_codon:yes stop_codon:yes gene_type:complete
MLTLLIIFLTSLVGLLAMIYYRQWELKTGKISSSKDSTTSLFPMNELLGELHDGYKKLPKEQAEQILKKVYHNSKDTVGKSSQFIKNAPIKKHVDRVVNSVKGKQELAPNKKPVSPFFKDVLEHKKKIREENEK